MYQISFGPHPSQPRDIVAKISSLRLSVTFGYIDSRQQVSPEHNTYKRIIELIRVRSSYISVSRCCTRTREFRRIGHTSNIRRAMQ